MNNFATEAEEGLLEEVTLTLSFRKKNGLLRDREEEKRQFPQRRQPGRGHKGMEMQGTGRSWCVARAECEVEAMLKGWCRSNGQVHQRSSVQG